MDPGSAAIDVVGYPVDTVHSMLEYIYNGNISQYRPQTFDQKLMLLTIADYYGIISLEQKNDEHTQKGPI